VTFSLPLMTSRVLRATAGAVIVASLASLASLASPAHAQPAKARAASATSLTAPDRFFGFRVGADYRLITYTQFAKYWETLAKESPRMALDTIGLTAEGRPQLMAVISSPTNLAKRAQYQRTVQRLALGQVADSAEARALAKQGKAVVWFDGGLHANEVVGSHQLLESVWQLVSRNDDETRRLLDDLIILAVHANPDGMELVSSWYMRNADSLSRTYQDIPRLYQKYIGHDNNRDFYMITQPETRNMTRQQFREWLPQIVYNHHQQGPQGTVLFAPPFRDPHNHNIDPLVITGISLVGTAMHQRLIEEGKAGAVMRDGASYQTWWNGGLRTAVYFHNQVGLLTEINGSPNPMKIPFVADRLVSTGDQPNPIMPGPFSFRTAIEYSVTNNWAVFDVASRHREQFLFNAWRMARNQIARGQQDTWTMYPRFVAEAKTAMNNRAGTEDDFKRLLQRPDRRDAKAYVIPRPQRDFATATKFVNTLMRGGATVHRAEGRFTVNGTTYGAGSYVVFAGQPFRAHVLDMFEPQDYPNDFLYPGGPPKRPYDAAGYTLAFQMGVQFDRLLDLPKGEFQTLSEEVAPPRGVVEAARPGMGWWIDRSMVDHIVAVNRLLKAGKRVLASGGDYYVAADAGVQELLDALTREKGLSFKAATAAPQAAWPRVKPVRIALWDRYGGSMESGWTRWLFEQYEFPHVVVYPADIDAGNLREKYDVLVLPDGAIPRERQTGEARGGPPPAERLPAEVRGMLGAFSTQKSLPAVKAFLEAGGTTLAIGNATVLAELLGLPIGNQLVDAAGKALSADKFYVPGSVLRAQVDTSSPLARGVPADVDVMFENSPAFRVAAGAPGVRVIARYDSDTPLRSGWAWGQSALKGGAAIVEADVGKGMLILYGPEVIYRAQPHGTFPFFFNGLYRLATTSATVP
jgi:hypothetical protein